MIRKSAKFILMKAVTKNVPLMYLYLMYLPVYVLDGGALLRKIKWIPNSTVLSVVLQYSQGIKYGLCCVVFDG